MAKNVRSTAYAEKSPYDYQCEEDVRTLTRAAEVMADRGRSKAAMGKFKKQRQGMDSMLGVLTRRGAN